MTANFPKILYHYTTSSVFFSIVKHRSIWLCSRWHLNDYEEGDVFNRFIHTIAAKEDFTAERAKEVAVVLESGDFFVNCLTSSRDTLSQWRGYAANGAGVCIGFDVNVLVEILKGQSEMLLYPVNYADSYPDLSMEAQGLIQKMLISSGTPSGAFLQSVLKERWSVKGKAFAEEAEYRLILTPASDSEGFSGHKPIALNLDVKAELKFRATETGIRDYYEMSFPAALMSRLIREVTLGPRNDSNEQVLRRMLCEEGLTTTQVDRSTASYR
jgi:hypothetical protein